MKDDSNVHFMPLPQSVRFGTDDLAAALERKRQAVLRDPWRPNKMIVPWPDATDQAISAGMKAMDRAELDKLLDDKVLPFRR